MDNVIILVNMIRFDHMITLVKKITLVYNTSNQCFNFYLRSVVTDLQLSIDSFGIVIYLVLIPCHFPVFNSLTIRKLCFLRSECTSKGGTSSGTCASGFGVCCVCEYYNNSKRTFLFWETERT